MLAQWLLAACLAIRAAGQDSIEFFTNYANLNLQWQFGFTTANIPVYSAVDPSVGYSSAVHYELQAAANAYDETGPATDPPAVFRPLFSWQGNTLYIVGYAAVTNDGLTQIARPFKDLGDPTISTDDNVWGIPWVVGSKQGIPAFNEYCYASSLTVERELLFARRPAANGKYVTNAPPLYTNQFYLFSISNAFGVEGWNFNSAAYQEDVTLIVSNRISIEFTNNYNYGTNSTYYSSASESISNWPGLRQAGGFNIPFKTNLISLPFAYWSESTSQLVSLDLTNGFLPVDMMQIGHPVHRWTLTITNDLLYALVDNETGAVLDFVNIGNFGSSLDINQVLSNAPGASAFWILTPATDSPYSPMSRGALNQIAQAMTNLLFANSLLGRSPDYPNFVGVFSPPSDPYAIFSQNCSWSAANPLVHDTVQDLTNAGVSQSISYLSPGQATLPISLLNSACSLGKINSTYNSGVISNFNYNLSNNFFQINFSGANNLPYVVWVSTELANWGLLGAANQSRPGQFQFEDSFSPADQSKYYQVRFP